MIKCKHCNKKIPVDFPYFCQNCLAALPKSQEEALDQLPTALRPLEQKILNKHYELYHKFGAYDERTKLFDRLASVMQVFHMIYFMWEISSSFHPKFSKNNIPAITYQLDQHYTIIKSSEGRKSGSHLLGKFNQFLNRSFDTEFIFQIDNKFRKLNKIMNYQPTNSFEDLTKNIIKKLQIPITADKNAILLLSTIRNLKHDDDSIYNQNNKTFHIDKFKFKFVKNQVPTFNVDIFCQVWIAGKCTELLEKIVNSENLDKILRSEINQS